jgi:hypothetical protein
MATIFVNEMIRAAQEESDQILIRFKNNNEKNIKDDHHYLTRIGSFIKSCLDYIDILREKKDKLKIIIILFKFLSSPIGLIYCKNNIKIFLTSRNKLQEMIVATDDFDDCQKELLDYQKDFDPNFYYINTYTKKTFNCCLHLYYTKISNDNFEETLHYY